MHGENGKPEEESGRGGAFAALIVGLLIVVVGVWLASALIERNRYAKCAAARHRNCDNIDLRAPPPERP